ncbi:MAG: ABC transporter permease, partial [Pseudomonadota bacterium]
MATLLLGLALATALWSAVQAINSEARASYDEAAGALGLSGYDRLERPGGAPLSTAEFVALRRAGWLVSPVLEGRLRGAGGPSVALTGLDLLSAPPGALPPGLTAIGGDTDPADLFTAPGTIFAAPALAERLAEVQGLPPVRAVAGLAADEAVTDIGTAQRLLGRAGEISHLL